MKPKQGLYGSFFKTGEAKCPVYCKTRDSDAERHIRARARLEDLWRECSPYVDSDAPDKATRDMGSVFWELYLAHALMHSGIRLVARNDRTPKIEGPDLLAADPPVWLEAVVARSGEGPDSLQSPTLGVVYTIFSEDFVLRLRNAIEHKAERLNTYLQRGYIKPGEATVIAISAALLEFRWNELPTPRIVSAVLATGPQVILLNPETGAREGTYLDFQGEISKLSGSPVSTDLFFRAEYAHISAVLYSPSDWLSNTRPPGREFVIVRNPNATVPLPRRWFRVGTEYRMEGNRLHCERDHTTAEEA